MVDTSAHLSQQLPVAPAMVEPSLGYQQQMMDAHLAATQQFHMSAPEYEQYVQYQNYLAQVAAYQLAESARVQQSGSFAFQGNTAAADADSNLVGADNCHQLAPSVCHSHQNVRTYQAAHAATDLLPHSTAVYQPILSHPPMPEIDSSCGLAAAAAVKAQQSTAIKDHSRSKLSLTPGPLLVRNSCMFVLGMLIPAYFWQTGFWLLKTIFKPALGFTGLHRNLNFKHS